MKSIFCFSKIPFFLLFRLISQFESVSSTVLSLFRSLLESAHLYPDFWLLWKVCIFLEAGQGEGMTHLGHQARVTQECLLPNTQFQSKNNSLIFCLYDSVSFTQFLHSMIAEFAGPYSHLGAHSLKSSVHLDFTYTTSLFPVIFMCPRKIKRKDHSQLKIIILKETLYMGWKWIFNDSQWIRFVFIIVRHPSATVCL